MKFYLTERLELTKEDKIIILSKVKYNYDSWRTTIEAVEYVIDEPQYAQNIANC